MNYKITTQRTMIQRVLTLLTGFLLFHLTASAQSDAAALAAADTTHFSVNKGGGWDLYNSYVAPYSSDSVRLELILKHPNDALFSLGILTGQQFVGTIKYATLLPQSSQTVSFQLLSSTYQLRIDPDGSCYLSFVNGSQPTKSMVVIPLKVVYNYKT